MQPFLSLSHRYYRVTVMRNGMQTDVSSSLARNALLYSALQRNQSRKCLFHVTNQNFYCGVNAIPFF